MFHTIFQKSQDLFLGKPNQQRIKSKNSKGYEHEGILTPALPCMSGDVWLPWRPWDGGPVPGWSPAVPAASSFLYLYSVCISNKPQEPIRPLSISEGVRFGLNLKEFQL